MKIVIDISKDRYDEIMAMDWKNCRRFFDEEIRAIHDGIPQRTGRWIERSDGIGRWWECSQCEAHGGEGMKYCMFCGRKMEDAEE